MHSPTFFGIVLDMKTQAIIFDLDGTLWDATVPTAAAWSQILQQHGKTVNADTMRALCGLPMDEIMHRLELGERMALLPRLIEAEHRLIEQEGASLYPYVIETLHKLNAFFPLFIVSNCQDGYIQLFLRKYQLGPLFQDFECWGRTGRSKGENIRSLMERNALHSAVYIGDTRGDEQAAHQANIPFIHAAYGFGRAEAPQETINELKELVEVFLCR